MLNDHLLSVIFLNGLFLWRDRPGLAGRPGSKICRQRRRKTRHTNVGKNRNSSFHCAISFTLIAISRFYSGEKSARPASLSGKIPFCTLSANSPLPYPDLVTLRPSSSAAIPKRAPSPGKQIARLVARPVRALSIATHPIVWLLNNS